MTRPSLPLGNKGVSEWGGSEGWLVIHRDAPYLKILNTYLMNQRERAERRRRANNPFLQDIINQK